MSTLSERFNIRIDAETTDDLVEGNINLFFTASNLGLSFATATGLLTATVGGVGTPVNLDGRYLLTGGTAADSTKLGSFTDTQFLRSDADNILSGDIVIAEGSRDRGLYGVYDAEKTQHIWSMGVSYRSSPTGVDFGSLFGLAYKHTNNTTGGTMGGGHQLVWCSAGIPKASIGDNIWSSGDIMAYSDRSVKTNINLIEDALNKVKHLNGYTFDRIDNKEVGRQTGVIAQEVLAVLPEAVRGDDGHYSVAYGNMVGLLIEAIKELNIKVDQLKEGN